MISIQGRCLSVDSCPGAWGSQTTSRHVIASLCIEVVWLHRSPPHDLKTAIQFLPVVIPVNTGPGHFLGKSITQTDEEPSVSNIFKSRCLRSSFGGIELGG